MPFRQQGSVLGRHFKIFQGSAIFIAAQYRINTGCLAYNLGALGSIAWLGDFHHHLVSLLFLERSTALHLYAGRSKADYLGWHDFARNYLYSAAPRNVGARSVMGITHADKYLEDKLMNSIK